MPLTTVSNAWREDGREAWLSSQGKPNRGRPALGQARVTGQGRTRAPKATRAFGWRGRRTTCGLRQRGPSSKPFAASAIAPGPFRGWGRKPLACIHTQREPLFRRRAPARNTLGPGPPHGARQGVRKPLMTEARHTDQGNGGGRDSWSNDLRPVARWRADGARTPLQKETRALESRAVDVCLAASEVAGAAGEARIRTP